MQPTPLDMQYGLRLATPLDSTFGLPAIRPMPRQLLPSPLEITPLAATRQFMGSPQGMYSQVVGPTQRSLERMGVPANVVPFSPARMPQPRQSTTLSLEDITKLTRAVESSGDYTALNKEKKGNTASGAYAYTDPTWNNYGGYPKAMLAPREVQDRRYQEDLAARYKQHNGDPFRIIAHHYLPAYADNPEIWRRSITLEKGGKVPPIEQYVRKVIKGTPLEGQFDAYLAKYSN